MEVVVGWCGVLDVVFVGGFYFELVVVGCEVGVICMCVVVSVLLVVIDV